MLLWFPKIQRGYACTPLGELTPREYRRVVLNRLHACCYCSRPFDGNGPDLHSWAEWLKGAESSSGAVDLSLPV
ncbi:hypothetical protein VNO78_22471 [Psophocarpus tetragonolobus]|uniref:Uncharacterized protein n=1 Tax=Psophocarpus tetragonolobus TaxID=3891 RepID=A0AAN9S2F0_PSOTE